MDQARYLFKAALESAANELNTAFELYKQSREEARSQQLRQAGTSRAAAADIESSANTAALCGVASAACTVGGGFAGGEAAGDGANAAAAADDAATAATAAQESATIANNAAPIVQESATATAGATAAAETTQLAPAKELPIAPAKEDIADAQENPAATTGPNVASQAATAATTGGGGARSAALLNGGTRAFDALGNYANNLGQAQEKIHSADGSVAAADAERAKEEQAALDKAMDQHRDRLKQIAEALKDYGDSRVAQLAAASGNKVA
jgi:hypothetical protein